MKKVVKRLLNIISVGDFVKINSNCENTRKPVYEVIAIVYIENKKGNFKGFKYMIKSGKVSHLVSKKELTLL